jgi:hypothetical protein
VRLGVRPEADFVGGINLFGREFGNYPQDVELRIEFDAGDDGHPGAHGNGAPRAGGARSGRRKESSRS